MIPLCSQTIIWITVSHGKTQKRSIKAIVILLMLATSPMSVNYSFAEIEGNQEEKDENLSKNSQKDRLGAILTEKIGHIFWKNSRNWEENVLLFPPWVFV